MTATPHALPAFYYTDPSIFEKERTGLLSRTWQFAGHAAEIKRPGDYFTFEIAGESLFAIHGRDGVIRSFYNVCQHRAHQMVTGSGRKRLLVCPYHAWSYDLTGHLKSAPNIDALERTERSGICLTQVRTEVFNGFIFVNLDDEAAAMDTWYPGVRDALREYVPQIDALEPLEWVEVPEDCNWKVSVENYSECYHCSLNHPTFSTGVIRPETYEIKAQGGHVLCHTTECSGLEAMTYPIDPDSNPHAVEYRSWFLWPLFSFQVYPGNILNTYHWRPNGHDGVTVWRGWYTEGGMDSETVRRLALQDRSTTVEEDIQLVESVQRGLHSRGYKPGPLVIDPKGGVQSEHSIASLHKWLLEALGP